MGKAEFKATIEEGMKAHKRLFGYVPRLRVGDLSEGLYSLIEANETEIRQDRNASTIERSLMFRECREARKVVKQYAHS